MFFPFLVWRQTHAYSINTPVVEETQTLLSLKRWRWWRTWCCCWCWWWSCVADEEWRWSCTGDNLLKVLFSGVSWQMRWRRDNPVHTRPGQKSSSDIKTLRNHHHYHTFSVWFLYQNGFVLLHDDEWYSFQGAPVENDNDPERVRHQILIILRKHLIFQN